jgi:hypothetical protein
VTGKTLELEIDSSTTADEVKEKIQEKEDIPVDTQRLVYAGKRLSYGAILSNYHVCEGSTLHLLARPREEPRPTGAVLQEAVIPSPDDIKRKFSYWQSTENSSFDDDMDIVDPNAYHRHVDLLSNTVAECSEFKRCGGQYVRSDEHTSDPERASETEFQDIPSWMWSAFGNITTGLPPNEFGSVEAVLASLWKTCVVLSRVTWSFRELEQRGFSKASFNLL